MRPTGRARPLLLLPALSRAFSREWRPLEWAGLATIGLYLLTLAAVGGGWESDPRKAARNPASSSSISHPNP